MLGGVVLAFRAEWDALVSSTENSTEELRAWLLSGPLPIAGSP